MVISIVVCHQWLYSAIISDQAVQLRGWAGLGHSRSRHLWLTSIKIIWNSQYKCSHGSSVTPVFSHHTSQQKRSWLGWHGWIFGHFMHTFSQKWIIFHIINRARYYTIIVHVSGRLPIPATFIFSPQERQWFMLHWLDAVWWYCSACWCWCRGVRGWGQEAGVGRGEWSLHHRITADHGHRHQHACHRGFLRSR